MKKRLLAVLLCAMMLIVLLPTPAPTEGEATTSTVITLNPNGGTGGTTSVTATYGDAMPAITPPSRAGYFFDAYYESLTGGTKYYHVNDGITGSARNWDKTEATATLYAKWEPILYEVFYALNGGIYPHHPNNCFDYNSPYVDIPQTMPEKTGYTFGGWKVTEAAAGGTGFELGKVYNAGAHISLDHAYGDVTLTAQWTAKQSMVTLNPNGGTGGTASVTATYDQPMPEIIGDGALPSRENYTFAGYYDSTSGGTKYYNADGSSAETWNKAEETTLYAQWTATEYDVTYDDNSATTASSGGDESYTIGYTLLTLPTPPEKTGYTFAGWKVTQAAKGGTGLALNDTFTGASRAINGAYGAVTLTTKWTANEYAVTLNPNGGTGGTPSATATYGSTLPNIIPPERSYTVSFVYNGATGGYTPATARVGYTFAGYFSEVEGGIRYDNDGGEKPKAWDIADDTTLYAHWTVGSCILPVPEMTECDLEGWYEDAAFTKPVGGAGSAYQPTKDITLYAKWVPKTYEVTLTPGKGYTLTAWPGSVSPVEHGGEFTFLFELDPNDSASTPMVHVNGIEVTLSAGIYTIMGITQPITVTVTGIVRNNPPVPAKEMQEADAVEIDGVRYGIVPDDETPGADTVKIDGVEYVRETGAGANPAATPDGKARFAVEITESEPDADDVNAGYPAHMTVWELSFREDTNDYTAKHIEEFDDLLQFSGYSIQTDGNTGIRMVTSVPTGIRDLLLSSGVNGYTLEEAGTLAAWVDEMGDGALVLDQSYAHSAYAYKRDVKDEIFGQSGELTQYAFALTDFTMDQYISGLVMRPYIILRDADGNLYTIYGGTVQSSIGDIAWQNRAEFAEGTTEHAYIWSIIQSCQDNGVTF